MERLLEIKHWKCSTIGEFPLAIQGWESMQEDDRQQYQVDAMNDITRRHFLKNRLPEDVKNFLETQTMLREDFSDEQIKNCVNHLAQKMEKDPTPMDVSPLEAHGEGSACPLPLTPPLRLSAADLSEGRSRARGIDEEPGPPEGRNNNSSSNRNRKKLVRATIAERWSHCEGLPQQAKGKGPMSWSQRHVQA